MYCSNPYYDRQLYSVNATACVGYAVSFPFIKHEAFRGLSENELNLYKYMFAPDLQSPTLAIIGCIAPQGPHPPLMEMQCRVAVSVFKVDRNKLE